MCGDLMYKHQCINKAAIKVFTRKTWVGIKFVIQKKVKGRMGIVMTFWLTLYSVLNQDVRTRYFSKIAPFSGVYVQKGTRRKIHISLWRSVFSWVKRNVSTYCFKALASTCLTNVLLSARVCVPLLVLRIYIYNMYHWEVTILTDAEVKMVNDYDNIN